MNRQLFKVISGIVLLAVLLTACGGSVAPAAAPTTAAAAPTAAPVPATAPDKVTLQSKWAAQAQFAGYYAALDQGYYKDENLDVTILEGGPNIAPEQVVASGGAQFGIDWMGSLLSSRDQGINLVNIAQPFQRGAILELSWKDSNINGVPDLKGKTVGVWGFGNEFDLMAALAKNNINKDKDLTIFQQPFDMNDLLNRKIDAAAAMTYNEYAQVLEAGHAPGELNVINFTDEGTAMLEDGIFTTADWLKDPKNQDIAVRFVRASLKGWQYCRDNQAACVDIVLKHGPALGKNHQAWMMNEINKLIWPSPNGIGVMDEAAWQRTADTALKFGVIKNAASKDAYTTDYVQKALAGITGDVKGTSWQPTTVKLDGAKP
jgi:NitT/TauT family transport system substrate-binding protein